MIMHESSKVQTGMDQRLDFTFPGSIRPWYLFKLFDWWLSYVPDLSRSRSSFSIELSSCAAMCAWGRKTKESKNKQRPVYRRVCVPLTLSVLLSSLRAKDEWQFSAWKQLQTALRAEVLKNSAHSKCYELSVALTFSHEEACVSSWKTVWSLWGVACSCAQETVTWETIIVREVLLDLMKYTSSLLRVRELTSVSIFRPPAWVLWRSSCQEQLDATGSQVYAPSPLSSCTSMQFLWIIWSRKSENFCCSRGTRYSCLCASLCSYLLPQWSSHNGC